MLNFKCGECYEIPTLCHIETTYLCNQQCIFCYNPRRAEAIDYDKLDQIVESVAKEKIPHVYLSGGEPSMLKLEYLNKYIEMLSNNSSVTILIVGTVLIFFCSSKPVLMTGLFYWEEYLYIIKTVHFLVNNTYFALFMGIFYIKQHRKYVISFKNIIYSANTL